MQLIRCVEAIIKEFRPVFSRKATFAWFVIVIWALMLRMEAAGVTSIVRCMGLNPAEYFNLLHFFHCSGFSVSALCQTWLQILKQHAQPITIDGKPLYVVDAIKIPKAGRKMPGVRILHQESDDNIKPEYIMGHFWGAIGMLVDAGIHAVSIPLRLQIQDGLKRSPTEAATLIDKMHTLVTDVVKEGGTIVADAYYTTRNFIAHMRAVGLHYIGKVRINAVAYHPAPQPTKKRRRGRPRKYGSKVKLRNLFNDPTAFKSVTLHLYGERKTIRYRSIDLFWSTLWVRFVLTIYSDGTRAILLSSHISLDPESIIYAYQLRFKIEVSFKSLVHVLSAFAYHFWMMAMPKLKRGNKNLYLHRKDEIFRAKVFQKIEAYERFANIAAIALGVLQLLSINFRVLIWSRFPVWFRTLPKHGYPSEHAVRITLQHELHQIFLKSNDSLLLEKILDEKRKTSKAAHPMELVSPSIAENF